MNKLSVENMLKGKESKYSLVMAVAKRAREITTEIYRGKAKVTEKPVNLAIKDFKDGKYTVYEPEMTE